LRMLYDYIIVNAMMVCGEYAQDIFQM